MVNITQTTENNEHVRETMVFTHCIYLVGETPFPVIYRNN